MQKHQKEGRKTLNALFIFLSAYVSLNTCLNASISLDLLSYEEQFPRGTIEYKRGEAEFVST
jgi:hypothetical protein